MKAITHYVFSVGASVYALSSLGILSWSSIVILLWLSLSINYAIDLIGHSRLGRPTRTRITHSVFTAPVWGALIALSSSSFVVFQGIPAASQAVLLVPWTLAGVMIALGHLFLDSLTQAGVYYWRHRIAIAHFRYDNLLLNAGFILLGVGLLAIGLI